MNLYQLNDMFAQIEEAADNGASPDDVRAALESIEVDFKDKAVQVAYFVKNLTGHYDSIDAEIKRLTEVKRIKAAHIERLKAYLADNMTEIKKASDGVVTVSYVKPKPKLDIDDESAIPPEWLDFKTVVSPKKPEILAALKSGSEILGCSIGESKASVMIK